MDRKNVTSVTEFILLGLSTQLKTQTALFGVFLICYLITLLGNFLIVLLSKVDPRLDTPMYFFLSNLSFLDICYTSSIIPKMLVNFLAKRKSISFPGCAAQMFIHLALGGTECYLLMVMAYDRYVAICSPLHYTNIMNKSVCIQLATGSWLGGILNSMVHTVLALQLPYCGPNVINHFFCEVPAVIELACKDISTNKTVIFMCAIVVVMIPFFLILITYIRILSAILKIRSAEGRKKAFSTCASHLIVVTLFYGTIIFMYMRPGSSTHSDQDKMSTLFYSVVTPMLNPIIYSLRNKDVKEALIKLMMNKASAQ
ncbi:olfactory receptor 2G3-like [Rhinatrema bivittatum]|uniref:olfactory receptor 2G3-like n=1 Tax=Rhinatrema bivittatum TaxID=194408 RepID=UPI0011288213|nr:olfactory receptor 2G3-like [Rhinatrema bivittatum]